jgi:hypothetical protein
MALVPMRPNGRDEQIAALDSQLRWTLSRFCSIAWFVGARSPRNPFATDLMRRSAGMPGLTQYYLVVSRIITRRSRIAK